MLTEECELRPFLERRNIRVTETDLGERIQQLDDQPPAHIVGPAIHKTTKDVATLFRENTVRIQITRTLPTSPG
jgi:L-lactate dehydrogenase complex protein LldF